MEHQNEPMNDRVIFVGQPSGWSSTSDDMYYDHMHGYQYQDGYQHQPRQQYYDNRPRQQYDNRRPQIMNDGIEQENTDQNVVDTSKHLQAGKMYGIQKIRIEASISGSLTDMLSPGNSIFKIQPNNFKKLQLNSRANNRKHATDEDFTGDLSKTVILDVKLFNSGSHYPTPLGVEYTGMNPNHLTSNNAFQHVIKPLVPNNKEDRSIYSPDHIFTENMYNSFGKCDKKSLDYQVKFEGNDNEATVHNNGIVWSTIMDNIYRIDKWGSSVDHICSLNNDKYDNSKQHSPWVVIPRFIAKDVYDKIASELKIIEKSFVNLKDFQVKFSRADGREWNDINGLIGQQSTSDSDTQTHYNNNALNKEGYAFSEIEISYITYD